MIHSLDSSHLVKTVLECLQHGIKDFAMVHDAYGTHACNMEKLNTILRKTFINMYSKNVMKALQKDLNDYIWIHYDEVTGIVDLVDDPPEWGELDITKVADSKYFFS